MDAIQWLRKRGQNPVDLVFGSPPYENARKYKEDGFDTGLDMNTKDWVNFMYTVTTEALVACRGLVAFVIDGRTSKHSYSAGPMHLMAMLARTGVTLRKPPIFYRHGIFGGGGRDWLRNDYEFVMCCTRGGRLPWSDNTALGHAPKYPPGGRPSHRKANGDRVTRAYTPPAKANPGNVIQCAVGGGRMGSRLAHENEAPFPEKLADFFIRSFCQPGGIVADPFVGSGTTIAAAIKCGRVGIGCDVRQSQVDLTKRRIEEAISGQPK